MPIFIKTGLWEKTSKGFKNWLNLDDLITSIIPTPPSSTLTTSEVSAIQDANSPSSGNVFATMDDITPVKTDLTLAELGVLISNSGLNIGLQYYVTDKDWLLVAIQANVLKPVKGSLHIFNGETLPTGIDPDVLLIDTGIVDYDINSSIPLHIANIATIATSYSPSSFCLEVLTYNTGITNFKIEDYDSELNIFTAFGALPDTSGDKIIGQLEQEGSSGFVFGSSGVLIAATNVSSHDSFRCIIEFHRSELSLPIPVPHIVSAETVDGELLLKTNDTLRIFEDLFFDDFEISVNNIIVSIDATSIGTNSYGVKAIRIALTTPIVYGDIVTVSVASGNIKNIWGGTT